MPQPSDSSEEYRFLINKLTIADARRLLRLEGGDAGKLALAVQVVFIVAIYAMTARAILVGQATAWHLILPLLVQILTMHFWLLILQIILRVPGLRNESLACLRNLTILVLIAASIIAYRANQQNHSFGKQFTNDGQVVLNWITDHQMHWPMLCAACAMLTSLPSRVLIFKLHGPPFASISFGCAAKVVILFMGLFLLPLLWNNQVRLTWSLWAALLIAEFLTLYAIWEIRRRLRKIDSLSP